MPGTEPIRHAVAVPVGGEIAVLEWPTVQADAPALMLAHANGFCAQLWRAVAVSLSKHYRVFAYDARGHGETTLDASEQQLHWDVLHDDLIALLERLPTRFNLRLPVHAAGHSMGGMTILCAAAKRPDLFATLTALDPVVWFPENNHAPASVTRKGQLVNAARKRRAQFSSRREAYTAWRNRATFAAWDEATFGAYVEHGLRDNAQGVVLRCAPQTEATIFDVRWAEDMRVLARRMDIAGLLVHAEQGHFRRSLHEELVELAPGLSLETNAGDHFFPMTDPYGTAETIHRSISERTKHLGEPV